MSESKAKEEKLTKEEAEQAAAVAEAEAVVEEVDMSLPESPALINRMAQELYSTLVQYKIIMLSVAANRAGGSAQEADKQQIQATVLKQLAALIQKEYPTARKAMADMITAQIIAEAEAAKAKASKPA
jgi:hypothetical protein